ncbi:MAG: acyl carrier protein [Clostridia bacterium]|nr:acyl carrier protein [Clostridia bacterium]
MLEKAKELISSILFIEKDEIKPESRFIEDLNADSLDLVQLIMAFEDEYRIKVEDDELKSIKTVNDVIELINKKNG